MNDIMIDGVRYNGVPAVAFPDANDSENTVMYYDLYNSLTFTDPVIATPGLATMDITARQKITVNAPDTLEALSELYHSDKYLFYLSYAYTGHPIGFYVYQNESYVCISTNQTNGYTSIRQLDNYLYEVNYDNLDYNDQTIRSNIDAEQFDHYFACSSFRRGNEFGRNLDWTYDNKAEFLVRTPRRNGRYATMGMSLGKLTEDQVQDAINNKTIYSEFKTVPFMLNDGINEKGLVINTNVVHIDTNDTLYSIPLLEQEIEINSTMVIRYLLDHFSKAKTAAEYLRDHMKVYFSLQGWLSHFMLADPTDEKTYIVEFVGGTPIIKEQYHVMTNFKMVQADKVSDIVFDENGTIKTPFFYTGQVSTLTGVSKFGDGLERYNIILKGLAEGLSTRDILDSVKYTNTYTLRDPAFLWYTEFVGDDNLTVDSAIDDFNTQIAFGRRDFDNRTRFDGGKTWQTVHASVYNLEAKTLQMVIQENDSRVFNFTFDQQGGGSGSGAVNSVNGKTGDVVIDKSDIGLYNVDNTADINKPISRAQALALATKYEKPETGIPASDIEEGVVPPHVQVATIKINASGSGHTSDKTYAQIASYGKNVVANVFFNNDSEGTSEDQGYFTYDGITSEGATFVQTTTNDGIIFVGKVLVSAENEVSYSYAQCDLVTTVIEVVLSNNGNYCDKTIQEISTYENRVIAHVIQDTTDEAGSGIYDLGYFNCIYNNLGFASFTHAMAYEDGLLEIDEVDIYDRDGETEIVACYGRDAIEKAKRPEEDGTYYFAGVKTTSEFTFKWTPEITSETVWDWGFGTVREITPGTGLAGGIITSYGSIYLNDESIASLKKADTALQPIDLVPYRKAADQDIIDSEIRYEIAAVDSELNKEIYNRKDADIKLDEKIANEKSARIDADDALNQKLEAEIKRATAEENKKVNRELVSGTGTAKIFNELDGGGAKFEKSDGTSWSFVGVNDSTNGGPDAQLYAVDPSDGYKGAKLDITKNGMYYTTGSNSKLSPSERDVSANELLVRHDIDNKVDSNLGGTNGVSRIFNETTGGGAKFENSTNHTWSFVGVNDSTSGGPDAQIYAVNVDEGYNGSRIDITTDGMYYTVGNTPYAERITSENEIAVMEDIPEYAIAKDTSSSEYASVYHLLRTVKGVTTEAGDPIEIAKDQVLKEVTVEVCEIPDVPIKGLIPGEKYLDFEWVNGTHSYIAIKDMVKPFKTGTGINITSENAIEINAEYQAIIAAKAEDVDLQAEITRATAEESKKVNSVTDLGNNAKSYVSNNVGDEGACLKVENSHNWSAVAVNNDASGGLGAQVYDWKMNGSSYVSGTVLDVTDDKIYYYTGDYKQRSERDTAENELAVVGDIPDISNKVDSVIQNGSDRSLIFNETDGGGAKYEKANGLESFVGVNDPGNNINGLAAQIYADVLVNNKWTGAKLDVTNGGMYYTVGSDSFADRAVAENELAVVGDVTNESVERKAADNALQNNITSEQTARIAADNTKVDKQVIGSAGTALIFNEADGGGAKFERADGINSFVGVNDGQGALGLSAQIYAVDSNDGNKGAKLDVYPDGMYYTTGEASGQSAAQRKSAENEIAVMGDFVPYTASEIDELWAQA